LCGVILLGFSLGTRERNKVWHSEESLWLDVTQKSPANGRGLMNYGLSQMAKGEYTRALDYFQRAQIYTPNYYVLEVNLGIDLGALGRDAEAEQHFRRAAALNPLEAVSHFFYGRWLYGKGRTGDAIEQLNTVIRNNPDYVDAPHLLMQIYSQLGDQEMLRRTAKETLARFPADAPAASWLARAATLQPTPESYVNQSLAYYQQGRFTDSIHAAEEALKLRPGYALAWNNIAAAWNAMGKWDQGIAAGEKAVQAAPDNQLARNNLAWAKRQKALGVAPR
jgi:tetratricopeptide (TPR) repeat protein